MNNKLKEKRETLVERFNEAISKLEQLDKGIQKAISDKENLLAHVNALKGAIEVVDQLSSELEVVPLEVVK